MERVIFMKAIKFFMNMVKDFFYMKITVFDITYTFLDLFIVLAVVGIICMAIRHFFGDD